MTKLTTTRKGKKGMPRTIILGEKPIKRKQNKTKQNQFLMREIPLLWVLTAKSPSTLLTRNNSRSWTQTRDGTKEALRKPYTLLPGNRIWTRIWDATHSRKPTRNWSSHVTWDRPPGRYPSHVTRPAKRQPAISNISAEEMISDETRKFHVSFL